MANKFQNLVDKLVLSKVDDEEGDFSSYIRLLESGKFVNKLNYGISDVSRGFLLTDPVDNPGALYCGGMGSGKSVAMRFTTISHLLANSEKSIYILVDVVKGMADYAVMFGLRENVAYAINDSSKIVPAIDMIYAEMMSRKDAFQNTLSKDGLSAKNIYEYERIMQEKNPNDPGLARIIFCLEEFHMIPNSEYVKFPFMCDKPGTVASQLKEILRVGRSYGICMLAASQRATSDDFPSTLKPGISQLMAFRTTNPGDAAALNLAHASDIKMGQNGRCAYQEGFIQYPFLDDNTAIDLIKKYYKPLKAKTLKYTIKDYQKAFEGEGNSGMVQVKPLKDLLQTYQQYDFTDIASRFLREFDFLIYKQKNEAYKNQLIAERDGERYAVLCVNNQALNTKKTGIDLKEAMQHLNCTKMMVISPTSVSSQNFSEGAITTILDGEDLMKMASVLDNRKKLEEDNKFEIMYKSFAIARKPSLEIETKSETDEDILAQIRNSFKDNDKDNDKDKK